MSQPVSSPADRVPARQPTSPRAPAPDYAREALRLNGITLSEADLELTAAEFERALEIARPLLEHPLADGLDQAVVYQP